MCDILCFEAHHSLFQVRLFKKNTLILHLLYIGSLCTIKVYSISVLHAENSILVHSISRIWSENGNEISWILISKSRFSRKIEYNDFKYVVFPCQLFCQKPCFYFISSFSYWLLCDSFKLLNTNFSPSLLNPVLYLRTFLGPRHWKSALTE